ncbi:MAG: CRISPR-associated endonuclease Cas2 [Candidatus Anstonellales archaeon]
MAKIIVFYDIKDDRRRYGFADFLKNIGLERIQFSGFMGEIREKDFNELISGIPKKINDAEDTVHLVLLSSFSEVKCFGRGWIPSDPDILIF